MSRTRPSVKKVIETPLKDIKADKSYEEDFRYSMALLDLPAVSQPNNDITKKENNK